MNRRPIGMLILLLPFLVRGADFDRARLQEEVQYYLQDLPFERFDLELPQFPARTFDIRDFGAVGDGQTLCTEAINRAIAQCSAAGGGTVLVTTGLWLTGPIVMQSNVHLHLERGALVTFSRDRELYPVIKLPRRGAEAHPLIYGYKLQNVAITGEGIFDGSGEVWRPVKKSKQTAQQWKELLRSGGVVDKKGEMWWPSRAALEGEAYLRQLHSRQPSQEITLAELQRARDYLRPNMILFIDCQKVLFDGITVTNSPRFALYPNWCQHIVMRNVKINNEWWAQNGDGIDLSSCRNALVYRCTVTAGDDALCLKASDAPPSEQPVVTNIVFRDCIVYHGHGGFVVGSNTPGGIRNVYVANCDFIGTDLGLRFKSARDRGGLVENIFIKNIYMKNIVGAAIYFSTYYQEFTQEPYDTLAAYPVTRTTPIFRNIVMDSIYSLGSGEIATFIGLPEMPLSALELRHSTLAARRGVEIKNARDLRFTNVGFYPDAGPVVRLKQAKKVAFDAIRYDPARHPFLQVGGTQTDEISIRRTPQLRPAAIVSSPEVKPTAVSLEP